MESVVRQNWLTRRLDPAAIFRSTYVTLLLVLVSSLYWVDAWHIARFMEASHDQVYLQHEWWRAWTTLFVHGDLRHLLSNTLMFFILGVFLTGYFGSVVFPALAFVAGGLVNLLVLKDMTGEIHLIGASGVVFWMGGFWLTLYLLLDSRRSLTQRLLRSFGVALALFMPAEAFDPEISYVTHFWGFIFGVGMALIYFAIKKPVFLAAEVREWDDDGADSYMPSPTSALSEAERREWEAAIGAESSDADNRIH